MAKDIIGKCLLSNLLAASKMTPTDLSVKTGISIYQLSKYIHNKSDMSLSTARIISKALKCKIDDLYQWKIWE